MFYKCKYRILTSGSFFIFYFFLQGVYVISFFFFGLFVYRTACKSRTDSQEKNNIFDSCSCLIKRNKIKNELVASRSDLLIITYVCSVVSIVTPQDSFSYCKKDKFINIIH